MTSHAARDLRLMTFNIWISGGRSLEATIEAIRRAAPDVVGLQECTVPVAKEIAAKLGCEEAHDDNGHVILSRHPLRRIGRTMNTWGGLGATIDVDGLGPIHFFDAHLHYDQYGPYGIEDGEPDAAILERERTMRMPGLDELFGLMDPFLASAEPVFLVGDFNAPSHLDYADLAWPTSVACSERGLVDAYRVLHPGNPKHPGGRGRGFSFDAPGITWTPITEEEPRGTFDRIDFIHYAPSARTTATSAIELDGRNSVSPWPSDHRAVVGTFAIGAIGRDRG